MQEVMMIGWKPGLRKISLSHLLQELTDLSMAEAKEYVDRLLRGEKVTVVMTSSSIAEDFSKRASDLGAIIELG
jgi:ribosomal protein L7/L12